MIFGDHVHAPASNEAGVAMAAACRGEWWTVGWLVPEGHARYVRLAAPDPDADDWWDRYRELFGTIAEVGSAHTATPDRAWFGIWEGYGWETSITMHAFAGEGDGADERLREQLRARARAEDARRHELVRSGLRTLPRFELPARAYYLLEGPVAAVAELREPGFPVRWQRPDLFWPDDGAWHVATDVDVWSLYVGGTGRFVTDLVAAVPAPAVEVTLATPLADEE